MYEYRCEVVHIVDGDTIDVDIDLGFGVWMRKERIRLYGIDTPESRTRDLEEKKYGLAAKDFLVEWLAKGDIILKTDKDAKGKFGRILGTMWHGDVNINQLMIDNHHAVGYHGQSKSEIVSEHLHNRTMVKLKE